MSFLRLAVAAAIACGFSALASAHGAADIPDEGLYAAFLSTNAATRRAWMDDAETRGRMILFGTPPRGAPETGVPQWYAADGIDNLRDLGGWAGLGGRRIRKGMILRCGYLEKTRDKAAFRRRFGVKTDLDLRDVNKMTHLKGKSPLGSEVELVIDRSAPAYADCDTKKGREYFRKTFVLLCNRERYPIVMHCHKGADRTGSLAFLLQGLLGADAEDQRIDWQLTAFMYDNPKFRDADRYDKLEEMISSRDGVTWTDKFVAFAHDCGITDEQIAAFREIMLESE